MTTIVRPSGKVARSFATSDPMKSLVADATSRFIKRPQLAKVSLKRVLRYENESVVAKFMKEHELNHADAHALFKDTLRFLWLTACHRGNVPSPQVDKGWHSFILFTMEYQKFCHKYFGRFLHHRPHHIGDKPDGTSLERTKKLAVEVLGVDITQGNWQYMTDSDSAPCDGRCSFGKCDSCREYCKCGGD